MSRLPLRTAAAVGVAVAVLATSACAARSSIGDLTAPRPPVGPGAPAGTEPGASNPVVDSLYPVYGNPSLDVLRYDLTVAWAPSTRTLTATATLTIRAVRDVTELALDFTGDYAIEGVTVNGAAATARRVGNDLVTPATLAANGRATLVVRYHGTPRPVPMPSGRSDFAEGVGLRVAPGNELWTMQEPYGSSTWYPSNDNPSDEALYDVAVTVPAGWSAVAHGEPTGVDHTGAGDTFRYTSKEPVASYAATLAVARYTAVTDTGPHGLPMTYWVRTGQDERFLPALRRTPAALAWLESRFGRYPFATAGVVMVESESAMETQQMVTYGAGRGADARSVDPDAVEETVMHEFAHQWFGDAVTPTTWSGLWLNEGWAMYAQWLWSVDQGRQTTEQWEEWALESDQITRADAGPPGHPKRDSFGETNVYAGPAYLLHLIHRSIGDQAFFSLAADWVRTNRNASVDRATFTAFVNRHTGRNFTSLIDEWLDSPTTPKA